MNVGTVDLRLRTVLSRLDAAGRLLKVESPVDPILELAGIVMKYDGGPGLLFDHVNGYDMPVFVNALTSHENILAAFDLDTAGVRQVMSRGLTQSIKPVMVSEGASQEVVINTGIDLEAFMPILKHAEKDGGRYVTSGVVIAKDPETGARNCSFHRFEIIGPNQGLIQLDLGRHLRAIYYKAQERKQDVEIAVCLGSNLALHFAGIAMGAEVPLGRDEIEIAGGFLGEPFKLVKAKTLDLEVPADAEIILEGVMSTSEEIQEGPFVEFVGYYSEVDPAPICTFRCITHRRDPIYYPIFGVEKLIMRKFMMEAALLRSMKAVSPIVQDCEMTRGGLYRFHLVIQVKKTRAADEGMQRNAALAAITGLKDLDCITIVEDDINLRDVHDVEYAVATRLDASRGLIVMPGFRTHEYLVDASNKGVRTKMIIDTTRPFREEGYEPRVEFMNVTVSDYKSSTEPNAGFIDRILKGKVKV